MMVIVIDFFTRVWKIFTKSDDLYDIIQIKAELKLYEVLG